jgi:GNAT superfamily N-acetyltransferase
MTHAVLEQLATQRQAEVARRAAQHHIRPTPARAYPTQIEVAPLAAGDRETVRQVFDGLGMRSRTLRFLSAKPRLTGTDLRSLTHVDDRDRVALVARHDGRPIGIARFVRDSEDPASADVAVAVVDAWQGRWIGTRLVHALSDRAEERGISRFTLTMDAKNEGALRLVHSVGSDVTRVAVEGGVLEYEVSLVPHWRKRQGLEATFDR